MCLNEEGFVVTSLGILREGIDLRYMSWWCAKDVDYLSCRQWRVWSITKEAWILINKYNFNRNKKDEYSQWENIFFLSAEYPFSFKNKPVIEKKRQSNAFVKESTDVCCCQAVFKCANQFHPRVHLCFKPFVSDVLRGIFQTKLFWWTLTRLYLHFHFFHVDSLLKVIQI